jgi:hypothetical protein
MVSFVTMPLARLQTAVTVLVLAASAPCLAATGPVSMSDIEAEYRESVRLPAARLLRKGAPEIAAALERDSSIVSDSALVMDALMRSALPTTSSDDRDMLRFGAHHLIDRFAWHSPTDKFLFGVGTAIRQFGISLDDYTDGTGYHGTLTDSLIQRPWANPWREFMLVHWMEYQCDLIPGGDAWKEIIRRGNEYLQHRPHSASSAEVMLHVAEAHETAWSLGAFDSVDTDNTAYRSGAAEHRIQAIRLYEGYLRMRPKAAGADEIRIRLKKIRANQDTDFRKYVCFDEC